MASFSRVLGGLAIAGGGLLFVVVVVGGWAGLKVNSLHNTQAYTVSTAFLKSSKALRVQLGDDAQINPLVWGAVIFGIGWGLGGYCPGPALVTAAGGGQALLFVAAMLVGMGAEEWLARRRALAQESCVGDG